MSGNFMSKNGGISAVSDHGGGAVPVTVARDGTLLDRRRVCVFPRRGMRHWRWTAVTITVSCILAVALRNCPRLSPTIAERIKDYRAQNVAEWVMYRKALASAAEARGWPVHWYDAKTVLGGARQALGVENLDAHFLHVPRAVGPHGARITSSQWRRPYGPLTATVSDCCIGRTPSSRRRRIRVAAGGSRPIPIRRALHILG
jgi:hypothetical protein